MYNDKKLSYLISIGISAAASLVFFCAILLSAPGNILYPLNPKSLGSWGNVLIYLFICILFITIFLALSFMVKNDRIMHFNNPSLKKYGFFVIFVVVCIGACMFYGLLDEVWIFSPLELLIIGLAVYFLSLVVFYREKETPRTKWFFLITVLIFAIFLGAIVATPNTFGTGYDGTLYNVHHSSAYIDSIYSVLYGSPYEGGITDQYGHYALFFYGPLKLFGASSLSISIILGLLSAFSFICLMGAIHILIKSDYLKVLIALSGGLIVATNSALNIYWQTFPHRLFFPSVMILFIALSSKKELTKRDYLIGSVISSLSILWNFESGIASTAAWMFFIIVNYYQYNEFNIKKFIKSVLKIFVLFAIYLTVPYFIVNLYNLLVTGLDYQYLISFMQFIGSMTEGTYIDYLRTELKWGNLPYLYMMFTFLGCVALSLRGTSIISKKGESHPIFVVSAAASIIGLALLTMWINRTVSVPSGVYIFVAVTLGLIAYGIVPEIKKFKESKLWNIYEVSKISLCSLALIGLILMGVSSANVVENVENRYSSGHYEYGDFIQFTKEIEESVPEDTLAAGFGTTAIYMELGWDKKYYKFDGDAELENILSTNSSFFIGQELFHHVDPTTYHLEYEFVYKEQIYRYYVRN